MNAEELMVKARRALASAQKLQQDDDSDGACHAQLAALRAFLLAAAGLSFGLSG